MSKHRAEVRPRWGRIGLTAAAATVVVIALAGGVGAFSHSHDTSAVADTGVAPSSIATAPTRSASPSAEPSGSTSPSAVPFAHRSAAPPAPSVTASSTASSTAPGAPPSQTPGAPGASSAGSSAAEVPLPPGSGTGRRAVFSQSDQRVWIVDSDGTIERTYLVSGSVENNLQPGTYHVYSRSKYAEGVDDSGYMRYFVRFAHGTDEGAAIGFHEIPTTEPDGKGTPLQPLQQLGTPESHGCIRQKTADAIAMWNFAHDGTKVVVVA